MERVFIKENNVLTRWHCITCGGCTDKTVAHPMIETEGGGEAFLCDECLEAGETGIRERLLRHAEELERHAASLRQSASEEWEMPSMLQLHWYREKIYRCYFESRPADLPTRFYKNDITVTEAPKSQPDLDPLKRYRTNLNGNGR